jgi:hypothetical protein
MTTVRLLAAALSLAVAPMSASSAGLDGCVDRAIQSCDQNYSFTLPFIRGWCYIAGVFVCGGDNA